MRRSAPRPPAAAPEDVVAAVLARGLPLSLTHRAARAHVARCTQALERVGAADSPLRVRVLAARALASAHCHDPGVEADATAAMAMADRLGDEPALGHALVARCLADPLPQHAEFRLGAARRILDIAAAHREVSLVAVGHLILLVALLERGEIADLDLELTGRSPSARRFLEDHRQEVVAWFRCLRATLDGDTAVAEELADRRYAAAAGDPEADALAIHTTQLGTINWMRGRIDGAEEWFAQARREHPEQVLWAASLAWLWHRQGRRTAAAALFDTLQDLDRIPRDRYWLSGMTVIAELATELGSREFAHRVQRLLLPHAGRMVAVGTGVAFWGTAARSLGLLEERLGMLTQARAHLELAVAITRRVGAQAWLAEAQIELAEFALRHHLGDVPAFELLAEARATCSALGFVALERRTVQRPRVRVMGRFEVISLDGTPADWTSRKARDLLKMLVAARGVAVAREVYMDALWPGIPPERLTNRFSVAVSTIRRAFDPHRAAPRQHHLVVDGDGVRLDLDHVDVDLERFLVAARRADPAARAAAHELYCGGPFSDEPYAEWALEVRALARRVWRELG